MAIVRFRKNRNGFTYIELLAGMSILLMVVMFFMVIYQFSNRNKILAREQTMMAAAAQNMAVVYKAFSGTDADAVNAAILEGQNEGFPPDKIGFPLPSRLSQDKHDYLYNIYIVTITIHPRVDTSGVNDYILTFYTMDKTMLTNGKSK